MTHPGANILLLRAAIIAAALGASCRADTITIRSREQKGEFQGYENREFLFRADAWTDLREPRTAVQKLVLDPPRDVDLVLGSSAEAATLVAYEQSRFVVEQKGARREIAGMLVKSITVRAAAPAAAGGSGGAEEPEARRALDISAFEKADLTPLQSAALARYKTARARYDAFLAQSSAMVAMMDKAQGAKREEILNALRLRKNEEQPVVRELEAAEKALMAAIPQGTVLREKAEPAAGGADAPADAQAKAASMPEAGDGNVVIIDTASLEASPGINANQRAAIAGYKQASAAYLRVSETAGGAGEAAAELEAAAGQLQKAQKALLGAFPDMTFSPSAR